MRYVFMLLLIVTTPLYAFDFNKEEQIKECMRIQQRIDYVRDNRKNPSHQDLKHTLDKLYSEYRCYQVKDEMKKRFLCCRSSD